MVIAFENLGNDCRHPLHTFLLVQAFIFNLFMILFAVRMYQQVCHTLPNHHTPQF